MQLKDCCAVCNKPNFMMLCETVHDQRLISLRTHLCSVLGMACLYGGQTLESDALAHGSHHQYMSDFDTGCVADRGRCASLSLSCSQNEPEQAFLDSYLLLGDNHHFELRFVSLPVW